MAIFFLKVYFFFSVKIYDEEIEIIRNFLSTFGNEIKIKEKCVFFIGDFHTFSISRGRKFILLMK